jgi:hypothetical protein
VKTGSNHEDHHLVSAVDGCAVDPWLRLRDAVRMTDAAISCAAVFLVVVGCIAWELELEHLFWACMAGAVACVLGIV